MARHASLQRHAITAPAFEDSKLHRARLVDLLLGQIARKLIVISAPAGYGKTTLLADFATHTNVPVCWARLSPPDIDAARLGGLLAASIARRYRRFARALPVEAASAASPSGQGHMLTEIVAETIREPFVLVLDDAHLLNASGPALELLDAMLEALPEQMTLLAAGREVLEVSLAKLMADGDLAGFGPGDLAFSAEELIDLIQLQGGEAPSLAQAQEMIEETRGWITGLLLTGQATPSHVRAIGLGGEPLVYDYLASVVLKRQAPDLRQFLLDACVLPVMSAEACNAVLRRSDSGRLLPSLVRKGLFTSATHERAQTYEFHPLFRQYLLDKAERTDSKRVQRLRLRAAAYLVREERIEEAVELYLSAGAGMRAAALMTSHARPMDLQGRGQTLAQWAAWAEEYELEVPVVLIRLGYTRIDQGRLDEAERLLTQAGAQIEKAPAVELECHADFLEWSIARAKGNSSRGSASLDAIESRLTPEGQPWLYASLCESRAVMLADVPGRQEEARRLLEQACEIYERVGDDYRLASGLVLLAEAHMNAGDLDGVATLVLRALRILEDRIPSVALRATALNNMADCRRRMGQLPESIDLFQQALRQARRAGTRETEGLVVLGQAEVFVDAGLAAQAGPLLDEGLRLASSAGAIWRIRYGCLLAATVQRRYGDLARAHEWLQRATAVPCGNHRWAECQVEAAAQLVTQGDVKRAVAVLDELLRQVSQGLPVQALARFWRARALMRNGGAADFHDAIDEMFEGRLFAACIEEIAAELVADVEMRKELQDGWSGNPAAEALLERVGLLADFAVKYDPEQGSTDQPPRLVVRALGSTNVSWRERTVRRLKPLSREVMLYLLDQGRAERDVVLEVFWPDHPPGRQAANLHMAVYNLRQEFGKEFVLLDGTCYTLGDSVESDYDVARFEHAAEVAERMQAGDPRRLFALTEAVHAYAGPFLPDLTSGWVLARRRSLEARFMDLVRAAADESLLRGQPEMAARWLRQALDADPFRDDLHLRYLEALGDLGRRSEIVSHYQRYVRMLADELGLDPPEPVRTLYDRLIS